MNPNGIKKNDYIAVTRKNGEVLIGVATKVGPWSKNPQFTVVNYRFMEKGLEYTTRADARDCVKAPADKIPKAPEVAVSDPVMVRWTLGKTKRGPMMMEGYYYAIPVLLYGKKVGELVDEGNGGCVMYRFIDDRIEKEFIKDCDTWCVNNGADGSYSGAAEHFWGWWDEARPNGISAKDYFINEREQMLKMFGTHSA